jgi:hypothetical protein
MKPSSVGAKTTRMKNRPVSGAPQCADAVMKSTLSQKGRDGRDRAEAVRAGDRENESGIVGHATARTHKLWKVLLETNLFGTSNGFSRSPATVAADGVYGAVAPATGTAERPAPAGARFGGNAMAGTKGSGGKGSSGGKSGSSGSKSGSGSKKK